MGRDGAILVNGQIPRIYEPDRYPAIVVRRGRKSLFLRIHTLVATEFCAGYAPGLEVNHINGNRADNRAENLEWVTHKYNMHHSARTGLRKSKFSQEQIAEICRRYRDGEKAKRIGESLGVTHKVIISILRMSTYYTVLKDVVEVTVPVGSACTNAVLTERDVEQARLMRRMGMLVQDIAAILGYSPWQLYGVVREPYKSWRHVKLTVVTPDDGEVYGTPGRGKYAR